jgi:hypothetical protein
MLAEGLALDPVPFSRSTARLFSRAHNTLRRDADRASADCCTALGMPHVRPVIAHAVCHSVCHSVTLRRCMPVPAPAHAPAPVPSPSLQGDGGMRYTSHQSEMLTTPVSSRLTPSPIHNSRRPSLAARAARPDAPSPLRPLPSPRTKISIFLVLGSSVPQHAKLKRHDSLAQTSLILDTPHGPFPPRPPCRTARACSSLAPGSNLSPRYRR